MIELNKDGVQHEAKFWEGFVKTGRFLQDWCSGQKTNELNVKVYDFLQSLDPDKVLDVGSGPVSILLGSVRDVLACDPLAEEYKALLDFSLLEIQEPAGYAAEDLPEDYTDNYDVVHCSNALDHVVDPFDAYINLYRCVKPGGYLIIQNHKDEADHEKFAGFHSWNISLTDKGLHIRGKFAKNFIPADENVILAETTHLDTGRDWIIWIVKKPE